MVFSCSDAGMQPARPIASSSNWDTKSYFEQMKIQQDFRQRMTSQDEATRDSLSFNGNFSSPQGINSRTKLEPADNFANDRERQLKNQQRWMLLLFHAKRCKAPQGNCKEFNCIHVQKLLKHIDSCNSNMPPCKYPRCHHTKVLISHYRRCSDTYCPVCIPVKNHMENQIKARLYSNTPLSGSNLVKNGESSGDVQTSFKRIKVEMPFQPPFPGFTMDKSGESISKSVCKTMDQSHMYLSVPSHEYRNNEASCTSTKSELTEVKIEVKSDMNKDNIVGTSNEPSHEHRNNDSYCISNKTELTEVKIEYTHDMNTGNIDGIHNQIPVKKPLNTSDGSDGNVKRENINSDMEVDENKTECSVANPLGTKSGRKKINGVSLMELFTPDEVREHIRGLRQWVGQSKAKAIKFQAMDHPLSENSCQLCAVEKIFFDPPPIYCTSCAGRIKRYAMYYTMGAGETQHCFCIPCYNGSRGDSMFVDETAIPKRKLVKKKNDEETEEGWVQCDKCEAWQHQVCALFNGRRNDGGQAEYTCPNCYISEIDKGERMPLPQTAVLGASDLPKTMLSDHIEQRLSKKLKEEREDRARVQGKSYDEVPGAEALIIRVVSSVDKKLEVKERFLEIFQEEKYPTEFPYKSKVVLLFQRIEGVEVCLFAMYVQEFGSECQEPNNRRVYLSYLDSVKYFRPDIKAVTGEALRTLVYHEILIGYLEYCKKRGFTSCYIWACPPLKGEDYILYCHPEIQKTPKSDKLKDWYLCMLKKALKENVVVELTNLYDHFFTFNEESKVKVTAARLPYFDGDYWPGAAEDLINQLGQEEGGGKQIKKGTNKNLITKRALKSCGRSTDISGNPSKDWLLMHKLGETICPMKEDFIMVHLQHACNRCSVIMMCGNRWVCIQCKNYQLCDKCYEDEQKLEEREKHPSNQRDKHAFYQVVINDVPEDTKDKDDILESEFFDTRQTFLSLCQGNHYQYDTLRRAKHSSMMVLYHLHNPTAPAFVTTCNVCHLDNEGGQNWRCEICPDFDVCNSCYGKNGGNLNHPHKLTNRKGDNNAQNKEARKLRFLQLRKMLDLLVHSTACHIHNCVYPKCQLVKRLFWHGRSCKTRASKGCMICKKMWSLLQLHARACKDSKCHVPRCSDLKQHLRRQQQQSESRRRAAVTEMIRQRAAEVAGNTR